MNPPLLIDLGNTRIKWRLGENAAAGSASTVEEWISQCADLPRPAAILICAVGAPERYQALVQCCLQHWALQPQRLQVSRSALGVHNHYQDLSQQGTDRWAAVLGARTRFPAQNLQIVSAGTALVVDTLTRDGQYLGGSIGPGLGLMKQALFHGTAQLPLAHGQLVAFARNTLDAIETGCLRAIKGMLTESILNMASSNIPIDQTIIFGGDAERIVSQLNLAAQTVDNLVLDGLYALYLAADGAFTQ
ncbi:type III pantothenate kinase [Chitinibacter sp. FCG-7]|uniref:Type III pantothenate kinase n=1 Tax=Chitinibacter mangrovi TaxID=3153927 RepID=A0AAU7FBV9_9NEIS